MKTLPPQIEDLVKCDDVDLDGVVGNLLTTVEGSAVMDILDVTSLLSGGGGLGIGGLLGKEGNEDSSKPSSGSKAAGGLGQLIPDGLPGTDVLGGLLNLGGDKGPGKGLLNGNGLSDIKKPVDDIVNNVSNLKDTVHDKVISMVPETVKEPLEGLLKMDIKETMLKLKVSQVTVDSTDITMGADGIQVLSTVTATIEGEGLLGAVINVMQFQAKLDVTMNIAVSSNNTQCVNLDVQDTHMHVKEMNIQLIETVGETLPLPVPLPLKDVVPVLLTAKINENLEKSNSCAIVLSDFNNCKNTSGLFSYQVQTAKISPKGLAILYCVSTRWLFNGNWMKDGSIPRPQKTSDGRMGTTHKQAKNPALQPRTTQPGRQKQAIEVMDGDTESAQLPSWDPSKKLHSLDEAQKLHNMRGSASKSCNIHKAHSQAEGRNSAHTTRVIGVKANIDNKTVPVLWRSAASRSQNASIAVTISSSTLKTLIKHVARNSSVQMNDLEAQITYIAFASQENNTLRVLYKVDIKKDEIIHLPWQQISKLHTDILDIKLQGPRTLWCHPEAKEEVEGIMSEVTKKAWSRFNELYKKMNIPEGVSSNTLTNSNVKLLKSNDLQAAS
ncbi:Vomeromodulin [Apodemus speciosus]|uniref:Vomeromodulin n=1 Tax=Apodemus speciosus TaxID=105296 RepID=A0ABQ0EIZ6_APOSI